jgi:TonB family protein
MTMKLTPFGFAQGKPLNLAQARKIAFACVVLLLAGASRVYAQAPIDVARDLYATADYDKALTLLDDLIARNQVGQKRDEADLYRALCFLALGRRDDADRAVETIVQRDPLYRPPDDIAPRMRTAFGETKKRLLPAIVQQQYASAKTAFDNKDFGVAGERFQRVLDALNDPDLKQAASQPPLSDIKTLASGFRDLSVQAVPAPPPVAAYVALPPPVQQQQKPAAVAKIYTGTEPGVIPPVAIVQDFPKFPGRVPSGGVVGAVEVVIDQNGAVESATMQTPVQSAYDNIVLAAARNWKYQPARVNGEPVKFRKSIRITIVPERVGTN